YTTLFRSGSGCWDSRRDAGATAFRRAVPGLPDCLHPDRRRFRRGGVRRDSKEVAAEWSGYCHGRRGGRRFHGSQVRQRHSERKGWVVIREFEVGDKVEAQFNDYEWVPAEVVAVDPLDAGRPYRVRHAVGLQWWCSPAEVRAAPEPQGFVTKDSGVRAHFESGMQRDTEEGKARFDLLFPLDIPYERQFVTRLAELMARGALKYEDRNWEKANSSEELARFKSSAARHFVQWLTGDIEEDHAAAVVFN